jgi:hypothetical protein
MYTWQTSRFDEIMRDPWLIAPARPKKAGNKDTIGVLAQGAPCFPHGRASDGPSSFRRRFLGSCCGRARAVFAAFARF